MELAGEIAGVGNVNSVSDAGVSALMARAAVEGAYLNVRINLPGIDDQAANERLLMKAEKLLEEAELKVKLARQIVVEKIACRKG
jgi:glutamate formiminotransferase/formiminotetrahydrofolate cyclodeaminase